jgi:hypothetical protein
MEPIQAMGVRAECDFPPSDRNAGSSCRGRSMGPSKRSASCLTAMPRAAESPRHACPAGRGPEYRASLLPFPAVQDRDRAVARPVLAASHRAGGCKKDFLRIAFEGADLIDPDVAWLASLFRVAEARTASPRPFRRSTSSTPRYTFALPEAVAHGELRPLRDPNDPAEQVFDLLAASA